MMIWMIRYYFGMSCKIHGFKDVHSQTLDLRSGRVLSSQLPTALRSW